MLTVQRGPKGSNGPQIAEAVAVTAVTVVVRMRLEGMADGAPGPARLDRWGCFAAAAFFVLENIWLLLRAAMEA